MYQSVLKKKILYQQTQEWEQNLLKSVLISKSAIIHQLIKSSVYKGIKKDTDISGNI